MANRPKKCTNFFGLIFLPSCCLFFKTARLIAACNLKSRAQRQQKSVFVLTQNLKEGGVEYDSPARNVSGKGALF